MQHDAEHHRERLLETERAVIASMLIGSEAIEAAQLILAAADFYSIGHGRVFAAIIAIHDRGDRPDLVLLAAELQRRDELDLVGGPSALTQIAEYGITEANVRAHAAIVGAAAQKRQVVRLALDLQRAAEDPTKDAMNLRALAEDGLARLGVIRSGESRFAAAAVDARTFMTTPPQRRPRLLGSILAGGDLALFFGRPFIGKTWHALALARDLVRGEPWLGIPTTKCRVGFCELEVPQDDLYDRLNSLGVGAGGDDANLKLLARPALKGTIDLYRSAGDRDELRAWVTHERLDVLVLDALSRIHTASENVAGELGVVLAFFDGLRHDTGCAVVVLHHPRKQSNDSRNDGDPFDMIRGTGRLLSDPTFLVCFRDTAAGLREVLFRVNGGREPDPIYFKLDDDGTPRVVAPPEQVRDRNRDRVLDAFRKTGDPAPCAEIAVIDRTGKPLAEATIKNHVTALVKSGDLVVESVARGNQPATYRPASLCPAASRDGDSDALSRCDSFAAAAELPGASRQDSDLASQRPAASPLKGGNAAGTQDAETRAEAAKAERHTDGHPLALNSSSVSELSAIAEPSAGAPLIAEHGTASGMPGAVGSDPDGTVESSRPVIEAQSKPTVVRFNHGSTR